MSDQSGVIIWKAEYKAWGECKTEKAKSNFLQNPKHLNCSPMPNAYNEHFYSNQGHRGSATNISRGRLIDSETMINQFNKGCKI